MPLPRIFGAPMRLLSKSYASIGCTTVCALWSGLFGVLAAPHRVAAQATTAPSASQSTCAGLLGDNPEVSAIGPNARSDSLNRSSPDSASRNRLSGASFGIGGARSGQADIILWVGVHADQVRFAKQPQTRVRLCWGGDTLRIVQRENIPSPVVAGTTYRNVYVAVELIGRVNAECLADLIGVRSGAQTSQPRATGGNVATTSPQPGVAVGNGSSASNCAFLGGGAGAGTQTPRTPVP
jgi:hypothetical protein